MAKFYQIQIGNIYLTETGAAGGDPCKLEIPEVEDLDVVLAGNAFPTSSGKTKVQLVEFIEGKFFEIKITVLMADIYENLRNEAKSCLALLAVDPDDEAAQFLITGTGDSGNFEVSAIWNPNKPYSCAGFRNGRINQVVLRFVTKGVIT